MLKHIVFMSQMDRPCVSHSETHVGKSYQRSVEKVIGNLKLIHFFFIGSLSQLAQAVCVAGQQHQEDHCDHLQCAGELEMLVKGEAAKWVPV